MGVGVSEEEEERWRGEGGGKENINEKKKITGAGLFVQFFILFNLSSGYPFKIY